MLPPCTGASKGCKHRGSCEVGRHAKPSRCLCGPHPPGEPPGGEMTEPARMVTVRGHMHRCPRCGGRWAHDIDYRATTCPDDYESPCPDTAWCIRRAAKASPPEAP